MTSFLADTTAFVAHLPETVTALLATSRRIMNCSVVPVILSTDETWSLLCASPFGATKQLNFLDLFVKFSDTMQFTSKLRFVFPVDPETTNSIFQYLVENKRYFTRTVQHLDLPQTCRSRREKSDLKEKFHLTTPVLFNTYFRNVRSIKFNYENFTDAQLELICTHYPNLEKFSLECVDITSDRGLEPISKNLKSLRELTISGNGIASSSGVFSSSRFTVSSSGHLKSLRTLKIQWFQGHLIPESLFAADNNDNNNNDKDDENNSNSNNDDHKLHQPHLSSLQHVEFETSSNLDETIFIHLQNQAPNLTILKCPVFYPEILKGICSLCSSANLKFLSIDLHCDGADDTLKNLLMNLNVVEELELGYINDSSDEFYKLISESLSSTVLRCLRLTRFGRLSDTGFGYLMSQSSSFSSSLQQLFFSVQETSNFTGEGVFPAHHHQHQLSTDESSSSSSSKLRELKLSVCNHLTDEGIKNILGGMPCLRRLHLDTATKITSQGLQSAFSDPTLGICTSLEELELPSANLNSLKFLKNLCSLKKLSLSFVSFDFEPMRKNQTDMGFGNLPQSLEEITLSFCKVADEDLAAFPAEVLANLKNFVVNNCPQLTRKTLRETITLMNQLESLNIDGLTNTLAENDNFDETVADLELVVGKLRRLRKLTLRNFEQAIRFGNSELEKKFGFLFQNVV